MFIVTGANGFIGSVLLKFLNTQGFFDLIAVDTVSPKLRPELLKTARYTQFVDYPEVVKWLQESESSRKIKGVFHLGAISSTTETDWGRLKTHNIEFSQSLAEYCFRNQIPFLYASSAAVYGVGDLGFSDQTASDKYCPLNLYGKSKQEFDVWIQKNHALTGLWYGFRFFNVYGPNEYHKGNMASLAFKAFQQIQSNGQLRLFRSNHKDYEDGKQLRDFVYVKDIVAWMWAFYERQPKSGIYNMGSGVANSWIDMAEACFEACNQELKIEWIDMPVHIATQYQNYTQADMVKTLSIGLEPAKFDLKRGIFDYYNNYLLTTNPYF